jgi:peptidyl-tRNA hydrolase
MDLADFVLQDFSKSEAKKLPEIIERAIVAISTK